MIRFDQTLGVLLVTLSNIFQEIWSEKTTSDPENWSLDNPAFGQSAATALVVQDQVGGEIAWREINLSSGVQVTQYFNVVDDLEIDFALDHCLPMETEHDQGHKESQAVHTTREYMLSLPGGGGVMRH